MYLYYKQSHKTQLLLDEFAGKLMTDVLNLQNEEEFEKYPWILFNKSQQRQRSHKKYIEKIMNKEKPTYGIAVDAWCSGNPGPGGYKGIDLETGNQLFINNHIGYCTNNIAEFVAIVHGLMYCKKNRKHNIVYTDSEIAIKWINLKQANTKTDISKNPELVQKLWRCEMWLLEQKRIDSVEKWLTDKWGEIPADFGRK